MDKENYLLKNAMNVLARKRQKKCNKCKRILSVNHFRVRHTKKKDGTIKYYHYYDCKECEKKMIAKWSKVNYNKRKNNDPIAHQLHLSRSRNNNKKSRHKGVNELADWYMRRVLEMTMEEIKKYPLLVEAKRAQLRLSRKAKTIARQ